MRRIKRSFLIVLGVALCLASVPLGAYAEDSDGSTSATSEPMSISESVASEDSPSTDQASPQDPAVAIGDSGSSELDREGEADRKLSPLELAAQHQADLPDGLYAFCSQINRSYALDCPHGSAAAGNKLQLYNANETDAQVWSVTHDSSGFVIITSVKGNTVDLSGGKTSNGSAIQLWNDNGSRAQRWIAVKNEDGTFTFLSALDTDFAIDVAGGGARNGSTVQLYKSNGSAAQRWNLSPAKTQQQQLDERAVTHKDDLADGSYVMLSSDDSFAVLASGSTLQLERYGYSLTARFKISTDVDGYRTISALDDYGNDAVAVLDVAGGNASNGTKVQLYKSNGTKAQKWIIEKTGSGYRLVSALNGSMSVDIPSGAIRQGSGLQLYNSNGTVAQTFSFVDPQAVRSRLDQLAQDNRSVIEDGEYAVLGGESQTRLVLDVASGSVSDGANVRIYRSNGTVAQRWRISHDQLGYLTLTNVKSGKVLDVSSGSTSKGANVQQYRASGDSNWAQKWIAQPNGDGTVSLLSAVWGNRALDIAGGQLKSSTNLQTYAQNGTTAQRFAFIPSDAPDVKPCDDVLSGDGWFTISPSSNDGVVLDVASGSRADGANLQLYGRNETFSQLFKAEYVNGYYILRNAGSGKVLDVDNGDIVPGTNVQQWTETDNDNQLFRAEVAEDGSVSFINKATGLDLAVASPSSPKSNLVVAQPSEVYTSTFMLREQKDLLSEGIFEIVSAGNTGLALDVASGSARSGANVQLYSSNHSFAQKWFVQHVAGHENTYTIESICSAKRLAVSDGNVCIASASDSKSQMWTVRIDKSGVELISVSNPALSLDIAGGNLSSGANVQVYSSNDTKAQRFRLLGTNADISNGTYFIRLAQNYGSVFDVSGGSGSDGANVQVWQNNDSGAQKWIFSRNGDGSYTIVNAASNKALDIRDARTDSGTNVQQWSQNGSAAQHWFIDYVGGGFKISSALNRSIVIDVAGGGSSNGTNIDVWQDNSTSAQRFTFQVTNYVPPLPADQQAMLNRAQWYNSNTNWLILTDTVSCRTGIFTGSRGNWKLYAFWQCAPGKDSSPTVLGEFTVYGKGLSFGHGYTCWYYTQFYGDYLFHSQPCYSGTFNVKDSTMGHRASAGCVRLTMDHAKWIYDNIPYGTKVVNY